MKLSYRVAALAVAALLLVFLVISARAEEPCYPLGTLKISFSVVFPKAKQSVMEGDKAKDYLAAYNSYGRPTNVEGDALLMVTLPNGTNLFVPVKNNVGCTRHVVGPRLHRMILIKLARGRT